MTTAETHKPHRAVAQSGRASDPYSEGRRFNSDPRNQPNKSDQLCSYSFMPNNRWFVFEIDSGKSVVRDLSSARYARAYLQTNCGLH
jgi:hypothetical protein